MLKNIHWLLAALFAVGIMSAAAPAHAELRETGTAVIDRKGPNVLMFEIHGFKRFVDRYMLVTPVTRFYDITGQRIELVDLKIPCRARIRYGHDQARCGRPTAISVHVERYWDERPTSTQWNLPKKEPARLY